MCWEDASIDRELLGINEHSKIMMISSAGCNALSYLLDNPAEIRTVDINPRQTALIELKLCILDNFEYDTFAAFFWVGSYLEYQSVYEQIQDQLSPQTREFWDEHINYFSPTLRGLHFEDVWNFRTLFEFDHRPEIAQRRYYSDEFIGR